MTPLCECGCGRPVRRIERTDRRRGWVKGEYHRYAWGHRKTPPDYAVDEHGCWVWQKSRNYGYGITHHPETRKTMGAHRLYYERANGPIPEGLQLDHLCRNRACVNPDHLEPVTPAENSRRGRRATLTLAGAREIKRRLALGAQGVALAGEFGVKPSAIYAIRNGRTWRDA